jgi:hypothetical protein
LGNLRFRHTGPDYALAAQVTLTDSRDSLSFDFPVEAGFYQYRSTRLDGVWALLDAQSRARLILTNTSDRRLTVTPHLLVAGGRHSGEALALDAHETREVEIETLVEQTSLSPASAREGGVRLEHDGEPGDLLAFAMLWNRRGFSSTVKFIDPEARRSRPQVRRAPGSRSAFLRSPLHLQLPLMNRTIAQVQIDQALIRDSRLLRQGLEVGNGVLIQSHGHRLLRILDVGVFTPFHLGKIIMVSHLLRLQ